MTTVAVVGGGITGVAAALAAAEHPSGVEVVVLEASDGLGGKIRTTGVAGMEVEAGPDAFLARVPHAVDLCRRLGLEEELVSPATGRAWLWVRGRLRPLPAGLVLGVPSDLWAVARSGIVSPPGLARAALDLVLPSTARAGDRSVGDIVTRRFGHEVLDRLVDPLLGGIHAGRADMLSAEATAPQLAAAGRARSLLRVLRSQPPAGDGRPVFLAPRRGLGAVVEAAGRRLAELGADVRTGTPVTGLTRRDGRWRLDTGGPALTADAVIVCLPAPAAASLLRPCAPDAARELDTVLHASVAVTTLAYAPSAAPGPLDGSGFLVPRSEGRLMTAATWLSSKWAHLARPDVVLIRASAGRLGDDRAAGMDDGELISALHGELSDAMGLKGRWFDASVTRWPSAFPQYTVGHLARVERIERAVASLPGLAVAGAAYRGVGIPACIASGTAAAVAVVSALDAPAGP